MKNRDIKVYQYSGCSTCRKAINFLNHLNIPFESIPIRDKPPTLSELKKAKQILGDLKKLFNVSGNDYREGNWKDKIKNISDTDALLALSKNGNLIKRPFVLLDDDVIVGFKEDEWKEKFRK